MNGYRILEWVFRWFSGTVFILSSIHKIMDPCKFAIDIYNYQITPHALINLIAIVIPYLELLLGISLIVGFLPRGAALGITSTLIFFIFLLSINLIRGIDASCGCFSSESDACELLADWYKSHHPEISAITKARLRTLCDIVRDIVFLIPTVGALVLLNRRYQQRG